LATAWPAKLTDREIINIYGNIGANTRAGATLFALEHDLLGDAARFSVGSRR
jgi:hypothetical protein